MKPRQYCNQTIIKSFFSFRKTFVRRQQQHKFIMRIINEYALVIKKMVDNIISSDIHLQNFVNNNRIASFSSF